MTGVQVTRGSFVIKSTNVLTNKEVTTFPGCRFPVPGDDEFGNSMIDIENI